MVFEATFCLEAGKPVLQKNSHEILLRGETHGKEREIRATPVSAVVTQSSLEIMFVTGL